jgi:hypothetical protein
VVKIGYLGRFKVWSNTFYLAPLILALYWHLWPTAILTFAVAAFGSLYHVSNEKHFLLPDSVSASLLVLSNFILCYLGDYKAPYFWIAVLFAVLAFVYHFFADRKGQYDLNHGLWHMYGALITLFCIFTFVL